ncbi:membrane protein containing CHASE2 [Candidatus Omnitrophus magneticus]|uniref:Membrane protein containing CHASE2 n=1 Tax=Candidatus Omnitrophus magneticus TaxID=1609969 RepID=A0A0F0CLI0_9BACT|nr:membrane protein containing CHASE2 [Candidatus Omnitrophus magneticus]
MKLSKKTLITAIFFIAGSLVFILFSWFRVFDEFEYSTLDRRYSIRPLQKVSSDIVIIHIGDDTIEKIGEWPIPRKYHALLINALKASGVKTIVFDVFFSEESPDDAEFASAINSAGNVYMSYVFEIERKNSILKKYFSANIIIAPIVNTLSEASNHKGFVNIEPDVDGKVRRIMPFVKFKDNFCPNITLLAALNNMGLSFENVEIIPEKKIVLNKNRSIPLGDDSTLIINYPGKWGASFRHYSYVDIIQSYLSGMVGEHTILNLNELKNSVCFVGFTATASPDAHPSPLEPIYPGVGVHASIYNSILNNEFIIRLNKWWNIFIFSLLCFITALITTRSQKRYAFFSIFCTSFLYVILVAAVFIFNRIWVDIFCPLAANTYVYIFFTVRRYFEEIEKREILEKELDIAKDIQQSFLPKELPSVGVDMCVNMKTARQVGGDLYDIMQLDEQKIGVMIGDVSGKGVPAALFMAQVVSVFRTLAKQGKSPQKVIEDVNNHLVAEARSNLFVTLTYLIIDKEKHLIYYSSGGHLPALFISNKDEISFIDCAMGMPLGLLETDFEEKEIKYEEGSTIILYTDGVTEAMDINGEMFTEKRLKELALKFKGLTSNAIVQMIHKNIELFAGKAKQHDDITIFCARI